MKRLTASQDIERRLRAGEPLTARQCAADYGCSTALLGAVMRTCKDDGCTFSSEQIPGAKGARLYTLTSPDPSGAQHGKGRGVIVTHTGRRAAAAPASPLDAAPARASSPLPERVRVNGHALPTTALPQLGADVQVCLLAIDTEGRISVGLRTESGTWLASVDGFSAPAS